jgi:hypothetical protein
LIWLNVSEKTCLERLTQRRYDPITGRVINLARLPSDVTYAEASTWPTRPTDSPENVERRLKVSENLFQDLESFYGFRRKAKAKSTASIPGGANLPPLETDGIMHEIEAEGLGLGEANTKGGVSSSLRKVFETIEGMLLKPVPVAPAL